MLFHRTFFCLVRKVAVFRVLCKITFFVEKETDILFTITDPQYLHLLDLNWLICFFPSKQLNTILRSTAFIFRGMFFFHSFLCVCFHPVGSHSAHKTAVFVQLVFILSVIIKITKSSTVCPTVTKYMSGTELQLNKYFKLIITFFFHYAGQ